MNEKLKQIENIFLNEKEVNLGKQCKQEYIVYSFCHIDGLVKKRIIKKHYSDSTLTKLRKCSKRFIDKTVKEVIDNDIYDLLQRGYDLITIK